MRGMTSTYSIDYISVWRWVKAVFLTGQTSSRHLDCSRGLNPSFSQSLVAAAKLNRNQLAKGSIDRYKRDGRKGRSGETYCILSAFLPLDCLPCHKMS